MRSEWSEGWHDTATWMWMWTASGQGDDFRRGGRRGYRAVLVGGDDGHSQDLANVSRLDHITLLVAVAIPEHAAPLESRRNRQLGDDTIDASTTSGELASVASRSANEADIPIPDESLMATDN